MAVAACLWTSTTLNKVVFRAAAIRTPTTITTASADGKLGWIDRVKKVTLPANVSGNVASETYEYDRTLDANGITNLTGAALGGRGLLQKSRMRITLISSSNTTPTATSDGRTTSCARKTLTRT